MGMNPPNCRLSLGEEKKVRLGSDLLPIHFPTE